VIRFILLTLVAALGVSVCLLAIYSGLYTAGIFVAAPFALGLLADWVTKPDRLGHSLEAAVVTVLVGAALMLAMGIEGVLCLAMALPLGFGLALLGASAGYWLRRRNPSQLQQRAVFLAALLLGPATIGAEAIWRPSHPLFEIRSSIEIAAPPETVWRFVVAAEISEQPEWIFLAGLAYPTRSTIDSPGPQATRRCEFSTGTFVEPITTWDPPRVLAFDVTSSPAPMREWSPYTNIHPPHLDGYFVSRRGEFRLTPLAGNRTRLEGASWYRHHLQPAGYWRWWSDAVIRRIHMRVLRNIKVLAEAA
jgi:uncharacterized protein YndB with AHSA1/START domain